MFTFALSDFAYGEDTAVHHDFKNEVFSSFQPNPTKPCNQCGRTPRLELKTLNVKNGKTVRMFRCQCSEQTWTENDE
ncbi:hypothetical protein ACVWW1_004334 [Bradyrhizobium sp. JR3.5]